jgi:hypothetical protein
MTVQEFLQSKAANLSLVAKKMWPKNKTADLYLYKKLSGERPFTKSDSEKALNALNEIYGVIKDLTI